MRMPPHNTEAEQAVLGAMMLDKQCALAASRLDKEDFYHAQHGIILEAIQELVEENIAVDILTVTERLTKTERINQAGKGSIYASWWIRPKHS